MSRTNIELDDDLVERAKQLFHLQTKREVVQLALERLVGSSTMSVDEQLACEGIGWEGDLDQIRASRFGDWDERAARR